MPLTTKIKKATGSGTTKSNSNLVGFALQYRTQVLVAMLDRFILPGAPIEPVVRWLAGHNVGYPDFIPVYPDLPKYSVKHLPGRPDEWLSGGGFFEP